MMDIVKKKGRSLHNPGHIIVVDGDVVVKEVSSHKGCCQKPAYKRVSRAEESSYARPVFSYLVRTILQVPGR